MSNTDRALIAGVATAIAVAKNWHSVRCQTEGCHWAMHTGDPDRAAAAYDEHLRTSARHTGGLWIDRDGRQRRGLEVVEP